MSEADARPPRWALVVLALVALGLRWWCVEQYERAHPQADRPAIDEASYDSWAREIAAGDVLGREIFFQEPLYPYALGAVYALAGDDPSEQRQLARRVQAVLGALTSVLIALLGARLFGARAGLLAGALFALHLPAIWFCALLLKPALFLPLFALFALQLVGAQRARDWLLVGVLGGLGALLRGNMLVLLPLFALWPLGRAFALRQPRRAALAGCAAVALGVALVLAPVALRNQHVGGRLVLTTSGAGTNFYGGNNLDNPYGVATEFDWVRGVPEHEAADWRHEASRRVGRELDPTQTSSYWLDAALASMRREPLEHARILLRKLRLALHRYETPDNHFFDWDQRYVPFLDAPLPRFGTLGVLGLCGVGWMLREWRRRQAPAPALESALVFTLYLATIVLTVMSDRARLPLVVLLAPFAAWFVLSLRRIAAEGPRAWATAAALAAGSAWLVLAPVFPPERRAADLDERDHNLAVELLQEGDLARSGALITGLLERHPDSARVNLLAAEHEYRQLRVEFDAAPRGFALSSDQARRLEGALQRLASIERAGAAQERYRAQVLHGAIAQYFGRWSDAERCYRAALVFDPADGDTRRRLAVVLAELAMQQREPQARRLALGEPQRILEELCAEVGERDPVLAGELRALLEQIRAAAR
mgnify:CR=1 FL=1